MKALTLTNVLIFAAMATAFAQPQSPQPQPTQTPGGKMPAPQQNIGGPQAVPPRVVPGTSAGAPAAVNVAPDVVVLTIGTRKMTRAQFEEFTSNLPEQLKAAVNGPNRRKFIEQYAELEALAQQARDRKLDQKPAVRAIVMLQTDQALAGQLVQDLTANIKPDDAAIKAYYDAHKSEYEAPEVKARHILIRFKGSAVPVRAGQKELTEEEALARAKDLREKIVKGADFGALAKAESDDTGSGANGGDVGSFGHGRMVKEFDEAAFSLPIGEVSQPVKSQFGYHIIQVESRGAKPFEDLKPQIEPKLKAEMSKKAIDDAKKQTPVVINDEYFGK